MNTHRKSEKGQVLILLVVGVVVLIGFTALAVDGGMVYSDRRFDQSVADSAALSASGTASQTLDAAGIMYSNFHCGSSVDSAMNAAIDAAIDRAGSNDMSLDEDASDNQFVEVTCSESTDAFGYIDKYLDVHVRVRSEVKTAFAHLLFGGKLENVTDATVRMRPTGPALAGYALYALDPDCSEDGINLSGTVDVFIHHGSAFSRSCIAGNGNTSMTAYDGQINCLRNPAHPGWCSAADEHFSPRVSPVDRDPWDFDIPIPNCDDRSIAPEREVGEADDDGYITLDPGYYDGLPGHAKLRLRPGLYCISGSVKLNGGGNIESIEEDGLAGVTVVFMDGDYEAKGNGGMQMNAARPDQPMTHAPNVVPGVVLIFDSGNFNALDLGGNSASKFNGTVYVPDGSIVVGGTGDVNHATQFIAYNFWTHGNSQTQIYYDGGAFFQGPAKMEMLK